MGEKMYQISREYKDKIDGLCTRYYAAMAQLKNVPEKIPEAQLEKQAAHISAQLESKMVELSNQFKENMALITDEFTAKMERLVDEL